MGRKLSIFLPYHGNSKNKICIENEKNKKQKKSRVKKFDLKQGDVFQNAKLLFLWKILFFEYRSPFFVNVLIMVFFSSFLMKKNVFSHLIFVAMGSIDQMQRGLV